jgi:hypothetical protein
MGLLRKKFTDGVAFYRGERRGNHMESADRAAAEEWAERLGTVYKTEIQYLHLWGRRNTVPIATWVIEGMRLPDVEAEIAERKTRGERLVGVLAPCQGPDNWHLGDPPVKEEWDTLNLETRDKMRLLFRGPYPFAVSEDYPASVAFTPEEALAEVRRPRETYPYAVARRASADGPITDVKAALMTLSEAYTLLGEHQSNIRGSHRLPDDPVVLVVMHGAFSIHPPGFMHAPSEQASITTKIYDARDGSGGLTSVVNSEIVLP